MAKTIFIPPNTGNRVTFWVVDYSGALVTGLDNDDFTASLVRNGSPVSPAGLTVYEIGGGCYHVTNQDTNAAYQSSGEEQVSIILDNATYGQFEISFWARNVWFDILSEFDGNMIIDVCIDDEMSVAVGIDDEMVAAVSIDDEMTITVEAES